MNKRLIAAILLTVILGSALAGCSSNKPEQQNTPTPAAESGEPTAVTGDLTVGIAQDIDDTIDPHKMVSAATREILFNVYEGLVKPDTSGNMVGAIASEYTINDAGDEFTFTLRDGVKFHNGAAVTVNDVLYSINRAAGDGSGEPLISGFNIESVTATDDKTVVVKIPEPTIEFLALMTAAIIPEGSDPTTEVVGTGPFKFVSRSPQENIIIEKNEEYWGTPANVDKVTFKIIDNAETLVMSLMSGAVDMANHLTSAQSMEVGTDFSVVEGEMNLVQAVYLNNAVEPFNNEKVRQALSYALDKQKIIEMTNDSEGFPLGSSMYPSFKKYFVDELTNYYTCDTEKAKSLLAEAGYPNGFDMEITVPSNYQPHIDTATVVAEQLKAVGVNVNVKLVDWNTWLSDVYQARKFQSTICGVDAANLSARAMLERFTSDYAKNFVNYNNADYDAVMAEAMSCSDDAKQVELYKKAQTILTETAANLYIQDLSDLVVMRKGITGYQIYPLYVMDLSKISFE